MYTYLSYVYIRNWLALLHHLPKTVVSMYIPFVYMAYNLDTTGDYRR